MGLSADAFNYDDLLADFDVDAPQAEAEEDPVSEDELIIAVMGSTGSGKSTFIKLLSGDTSIVVGDSLESETSDIQTVPFIDRVSGRRVIIVDTPGFDDSRDGITDTEVLKRIANFLLAAYDANRKLNGLIYVQRISDPRFGGQQSRNLKMFRNLCGTEAFQNVVVLTTFWDRVKELEGSMREKQLKSKFFKELTEGGALFMKHDRTFGSAQAVLQHIIALIPTNVDIQTEIRRDGKRLEDTAAGSVHRQEVEAIMAKHREEIEELAAEMRKLKASNSALAEDLERERVELKEKLARWEAERAELKNGLDDAQSVATQLKAAIQLQGKAHEESHQKLERDWTERLKTQAQAQDAALKTVEDRLSQGKEAARLNEQQAQERLNILEKNAAEDRQKLEEQRKQDENVWSSRIESQRQAHANASQLLEDQMKQQRDQSGADLKRVEDMMKRLEEKADKDRRDLEKRRQDEEQKWSERLRMQDEARTSAHQKIETFIPTKPMAATRNQRILVRASSVRDSNAAAYYLITPPIAPEPCKPAIAIASIKFRIWSHDQGWSSQGSGVYQDSWTWFEAAILRDADPGLETKLLNFGTMSDETLDSRYSNCVRYDGKNRWLIQTNVRASSVSVFHEVTWSPSAAQEDLARKTGCGNGAGFLSALSIGDRIAVIARARYPCWENHVERVEAEVIFC